MSKTQIDQHRIAQVEDCNTKEAFLFC